VESDVIGREAELHAVAAFLDALAAGPAGLLLEGEAGIGKTTLWLGGPWSIPFEEGKVLLLLTGFLVVPVAAAWAAWHVWNGSMLGGVLGLALLPAEAVFWYGLRTPAPLAAWPRQGDPPDRRMEVPQLATHSDDGSAATNLTAGYG
jgi:hypothetical protein